MQVRSITCKLTRTNLTEGHTRTVVRVDVGRNLEDKSGKLRLVGVHRTFFCQHRTRTRSDFHKTVEQLLHTEVVQCRTEEYRSQFSFQVLSYLEFRIHSVNQFQFIAQFLGQRRTDVVVQVLGMDIHFHLFRHYLLRRLEEIQFLLINIIYSLKTRTAFDRPRQRTHMNGQFFLQFIEQIERILRLTVHLIYENDNRSVSHTAHLHQLARLSFHTLRTVHHDDYTVYRRKRTVSVFRKILVTRRIENIDFIIVVIKLHHGGSYRDTTLLLDVHPVGCGGLFDLVRLYRSRYLNLTSEKQ